MWPTRICVPVSAVCAGRSDSVNALREYIRSCAFLGDDTQLVVFYDDRTLADHVDPVREQLSGVQLVSLNSLLRKQVRQTLVIDYDRARAALISTHCFVHVYHAKRSVTCGMLMDALIAYALAHM